jgi:protein phosphatase
MRRSAARCLTRQARAMEAAGLWDELKPIGAVWTPKSCPGTPRRRRCSRNSTPPSRARAGRRSRPNSRWRGGAGRDLAGADALVAALRSRLADIEAYATAYARYCWDVNGLQDLRVAPFHLLAVEGRTLLDHDHRWHLRHARPFGGRILAVCGHAQSGSGHGR